MDRPPVFADEAFAAALEVTRASDRWLIVDATASWCGPCKNMDQTTWRDSEVVAWLETYATALQIDVDAEQEWARTHAINAMPTLIAFKQGKEFDRIVGGRKPRQLLDWLQGLQQGQTAVDRLRHARDEGESDVDRRYELARALLTTGRLDEAASEFAWLWEHAAELNPEMAGVRGSFMAGDIETLVTESEPARSLFREIRARTALEAEADPVGKARFDWIVLNEVLGEADATLAWFDLIAATRPEQLDMPELANRLLPLLLSRDRWADAARLVDDGVADVVRHYGYFNWDQFPPEIGEEFKNQLIEMSRESFRQNAAQIRHMLIAANRTEEAAAVERKALDLDPSEEMRTWLAKPRDQLRPQS
jgi:thioredoxin 1